MRVNLNNINKRLENLGHTPPQGIPKVIPDLKPQVHILRETNPDNRMCGNVQIDAPSFDGSLDPNKFLKKSRTSLQASISRPNDYLGQYEKNFKISIPPSPISTSNDG